MTLTIKREATDKTKGFFLQKLLAVSLALNEVEVGGGKNFFVAVEWEGDVFLNDSQDHKIVFENKEYASKDFTFNSYEILNTLVYFLDYWINQEMDASIRFCFYATNQFGKEYNAAKAKKLGLLLPDKAIIELLNDQDFDADHLLNCAKSMIKDEYESQYTSNKNVSLSDSNFSKISAFTDDQWKDFLKAITWSFGQPTFEEQKDLILDRIRNSSFSTRYSIAKMEELVRAQLMWAVEEKQYESDVIKRCLFKSDVENAFLKVSQGIFSDEAEKYLEIDLDELRPRSRDKIAHFLTQKYTIIGSATGQPIPLIRKVELLDPSEFRRNPKIEPFEKSNRTFVEIGSLKSIIEGMPPGLILGDLGSGKSTALAQLAIKAIDDGIISLPLLIPAYYFDRNFPGTSDDLMQLVSNYVNEEINPSESLFDLRLTIKTNKPLTIIADGLDELGSERANKVLGFLQELKTSYASLSVVASARPVEIAKYGLHNWACYSMQPLSKEESLMILKNEAQYLGLEESDSEKDAEDRYALLSLSEELKAISSTPLMLLAIRDELDSGLTNKSIGDVLHSMVKRKLKWDESDQKGNPYENFLKHFERIKARKSIYGAIAKAIILSDKKAIPEEQLDSIISRFVPESDKKNELVAEGIAYFKAALLQQAGREYTITSAPMLEFGLGVWVSDQLSAGVDYQNEVDQKFHWRSISFAGTVLIEQGEFNPQRNHFKRLVDELLNSSEANSAPAAILVSETNDLDLAKHFLEKLSTVSFRPIRSLHTKEHSALLGFANCINILGEVGFNWLFTHYLDTKYPLLHYETDLAAGVFEYLAILNNFDLPVAFRERIKATIPFAIKYRTRLCFQLLPSYSVVDTLIPDIEDRLRLLAASLDRPLIREKSVEILKRLAEQGYKEDTLKALEIAANDRGNFHALLNPSFLWLQINDAEYPLSEKILNSAIISLSKDFDPRAYRLLEKLVPAASIEPFLKYKLISNSNIGAAAAILLFKNANRDFRLIAPALVAGIDWLDKQNYLLSEEISQFLLQDMELLKEVVIEKMPTGTYMGIPPAYWRFFLDYLIKSDEIHLEEWFKSMRSMDKHKLLLIRYPEIREKFRVLFASKPAYLDGTIHALGELDPVIRYNSAAILVSVVPQKSNEAAEIIFRSQVSQFASNTEWQIFILNRNYGNDVLKHLKSICSHLSPNVRGLILILLTHNNWILSTEENDEMIKHLVGQWYFLDVLGEWHGGRYPKLVEKEEYKEKFLRLLASTEIRTIEYAAKSLLEFHGSNLTDEQKWKVEIICLEFDEDRALSKVLSFEQNRDQPKFRAILEAWRVHYENVTTKRSFAKQLIEAWFDDNDWDGFLEGLFLRRSEHAARDLEGLFYDLKSILQKRPELEGTLQHSISDMIVKSRFNHGGNRQRIFPYVLLLANELGIDVLKPIQAIIQEYNGSVSRDEIVAGLAKRVGFDLDSLPSYPAPGYITLFGPYQSCGITQITNEVFWDLLIDALDTPPTIFSILESILVYGNHEDLGIESDHPNSFALSYVRNIINYCSGKLVASPDLIRNIDVDWSERRDRRDVRDRILAESQSVARISLDGEERTKFFESVTEKIIENPAHSASNLILFKLREGVSLSTVEYQLLLKEFLEHQYLLMPFDLVNLEEVLLTSGYDSSEFLTPTNQFLQSIVDTYGVKEVREEYHIAFWFFGLLKVWWDGEIDTLSKRSLLLGLLYLVDSFRPDPSRSPFATKIPGEQIMRKIDHTILEVLFKDGLKSNHPEVRVICRLMSIQTGHIDNDL